MHDNLDCLIQLYPKSLPSIEQPPMNFITFGWGILLISFKIVSSIMRSCKSDSFAPSERKYFLSTIWNFNL